MSLDENAQGSLDHEPEATSLATRQLVIHQQESFSVCAGQRQQLPFPCVENNARFVLGQNCFRRLDDRAAKTIYE